MKKYTAGCDNNKKGRSNIISPSVSLYSFEYSILFSFFLVQWSVSEPSAHLDSSWNSQKNSLVQSSLERLPNFSMSEFTAQSVLVTQVVNPENRVVMDIGVLVYTHLTHFYAHVLMDLVSQINGFAPENQVVFTCC